MACPRCRRRIPSRARFCPECGASLAAGSAVARADAASPGASSSLDGQALLGATARTAASLCDAAAAGVFGAEDDRLRLIARYGSPRRSTGSAETPPITRHTAHGRAMLDRRTTRAGATVATPILVDGTPVGVIAVRRARGRPWSRERIRLLELLATQTALAVQAVDARDRELAEALEQQTATAEVLRAISGSPSDLQPVLDTVVRAAARFCGATDVAIVRLDGATLRGAAAVGQFHDVLVRQLGSLTALEIPVTRGSVTGRAVLERRPVHVHDLAAESADEFPEGRELQRRFGHHTVVAAPLLREGIPLGAIALFRMVVEPFSERQLELLRLFADQAVIAIENVRLFKDLGTRNRELSETLEQQTATGEILRVISSSPTDVQPVFDTIAQSAARLCEAQFCHVFRFDGQLLHFAAHHGLTPEGLDGIRRAWPRAPDFGSAAGRSILSGGVEHIPDVHADADYALGALAQVIAYRSVVAVPIVREGRAVGAIAVARSQAGLFPDRQIEVLKTFADQAVIAIENVRLFQELEARTGDLTRSVGELQALGEVSQAVSSTLDLETVLETIVSRAVQLCGSENGVVYEFDEPTQTFRARATHQITPEYLEVLRATPIRLGEGAMGRAGAIREPVEVSDVQDEHQVVAPQVRGLLTRQGTRSFLAVPLVREGRLLGGIVILRRERGAFSPEVVATLQTFAAQSVLAIHNARLFREIQRQKQYSDALVETSPVAITTLDLRGIVVGWNPGAERLFGYSAAEAFGRDVQDLVATPEIREEMQANLGQTLGGGRVRAIARRARKDGSLVDVEISSVPVIVDGAKVGVIAIYHDITELLQARREAETATEAKSAFLATMSHEIRTPMNAVIGMSGLLLGTALTDEQREYAEVVRQSGDALLTVINDILDFSKIEAGKLELESQPFDLRECVEGALDLVATRAAEKGLDLAYLVGDGTPAAFVGDVTRLRQILLNLLSNAVKFTEAGEVVLSVSARRLAGAASLHELDFSVRDTGIGIPPDRVGRLFQSFSQVDASTTRRYGGTGLGLAISQRLTELMGGRIGVTSEVGRGSEFRFTIRAASAEATASPRRDLSGVQPSLHGKRVLVVDDNATNRRILSAHLDAWGMPARATGSPGEALAWIRADERFDVGILDMHMPEMDGVALARAIREHPAGAGLALVLFTSLGRREARAEEEGFAAYLHKPIKPSQLFDTLAALLADRPVHVRERGVTGREIDADMARRHPLRILLAEDNVVNQKVALRLLGQMGYRADVAGNGLEAVDAVTRQTYDVVLMDVQMPELDGFEASREINRRWPGPRPRIVAMTANAMQGDRELCAAAGMDDYVAKPIRVEELVAALERSRWRTDLGGPGAGPGAADAPRGPGLDPGSPEAPTVPGDAPAAVDRTAFDRLTATMGGTFVAELVDTFDEDARELIAALRGALAATDIDAFRRAAHSLKSTSETLGATGLAALARELEAMARAGSLDGAGERVERLADRYELVARALGELRHGLPA